MDNSAQSLSVKRAQVEFHNFASLGEPERAMRVYAEENERRGAVLRNHLHFVGGLSPFLEIGANAGHTSYMLANEFDAHGFALDISADSLRHGVALQDAWALARAPVRVAGDAVNLPFRDGSLRTVFAFQMLSQFMNMESVFLEVKRVLAPGGCFIFAEEPLKRMLTLSLYRCPYWESMRPWERKMYEWGLLGYLVRDVIGAHQEESFGIRQNHTMGLKDWHRLVARHFANQEYDIFVPERGSGERIVRRLARKMDRAQSDWLGARLLGGTLAAVCRKAGDPAPPAPFAAPESYVRCPDCHADLWRDADETLRCNACAYAAPYEGHVYNLLPSEDKKALYPGDREDIIDFTLPGHAAHLREGWYELEGTYGNKYRWVGASASFTLKNLNPGTSQMIRIRGFAHERWLSAGSPTVRVVINGTEVKEFTIDRVGLFILETAIPAAQVYDVELVCAPVWMDPADDRALTANFSMIRLNPLEA